MNTKTLKLLIAQGLLALHLGQAAPAHAQAAPPPPAASPNYISPGIAGVIMAWLALFQ